MRRHATWVLYPTVIASALSAQSRAVPELLRPTPACESCAIWNTPQAPLGVFGNTHYVGTRGLSAVLITGAQGHILIDGGLRESAPLIAASIRALGFRPEDIKLIVTSHVHYDHAGGVSALQRLSRAAVAATAPAARVLRGAPPGADDPQFGILSPIDRVPLVRVVRDGEVLRVGELSVTAHLTAGHAPGGTSWSWTSCEGARCLHMVYADSQTPVSADGFQFSRSVAGQAAVAAFRAGQARLDALPCDILITPHPESSAFWTRVEARGPENPDALVDGTACHRYVASGRERLAARLAREDSAARQMSRP